MLEVGGDFNFAGNHAWKAEVPLLGTLTWGDYIFPGVATCKVQVPPTSSTGLAGPSCIACVYNIYFDQFFLKLN